MSFVFLALVFALTSCREDGRAGGAELATGPSTFGLVPLPQRETLRVGFFAGSPMSYPFLFADRLGFFRELNIDIVYSTFTNGPAMIEARSTWDIGTAGVGGTFVGMVGHDLRVIGISDYEENIALFARPGSRLAQERNNPDAWRGTQWLFPRGTTAQAVLVAALGNMGLGLNDITSVNMDVVSALTAFHNHGDGLASWQAMAFVAEDRGFVRLEDASTLDIAFASTFLASEEVIRDRLDLLAYVYIVFHKTWEWANASPANFERVVHYFLEHSLDEGLAVDEDIARRVMEWFRAPFLRRGIEVMTETVPDAAGLYTARELLQAERDILVGLDFLISEHLYTPQDRVNILDRRLVDNAVAVRAQAIMEEQGISF